MKRCLITGGAGFIGSNLAEYLYYCGYDVDVIDDLSLGDVKNIKWNGTNFSQESSINFFQVDFSNYNELDRFFRLKRNYKVIFHLGALPRVQYSIKEPKKTHDANVNGTLNMLLMAKEYNVEKFVFSSSSSIYGNQDKLPLTEDMKPNPLSPYALHKLIGEQYCEQFNRLYGLKTICLRYFNVWGPKQNPNGDYACFLPKLINCGLRDKEMNINGDGNQTRDWTFVYDVVKANFLAASAKEEAYGKNYNIGGGKAHSVNDICSIVSKALNKNIKLNYGPSVVEAKHTLANIDLARKYLEWSPEMDFEKGLKITIDYVSILGD